MSRPIVVPLVRAIISTLVLPGTVAALPGAVAAARDTHVVRSTGNGHDASPGRAAVTLRRARSRAAPCAQPSRRPPRIPTRIVSSSVSVGRAPPA